MMRLILTLLATILLSSSLAQSTFRMVPHSDLKILDPIWTTAYITRNFGYMVYDTLFSVNEALEPQPQMVSSYEVSEDGLTYSFTLRDGLAWHNGEPVISADVIASLERWMVRDVMGQTLATFVDSINAVDDASFEIVLNEPYGLVIDSLAKPSSNVPFIMPEALAQTPPDEQITEVMGSGPYIFVADEWQPGNKVVFEKNPNYQPRNEEPSWASGGKVVNVDRVEWIIMPDAQTQVNALITGEIDYIEQVAADLVPLLEDEEGMTVRNTNPLGTQYMLRFNHLHPPFDNATVRRAALAAIKQEDFLQAAIGNPDYYQACAAMFVCDTPFATEAGADIIMEPDLELAKQLLEEAGYDGTPVVIMDPTDLGVLINLAPVAAQALKRAGFTVDLQSMDWQTLVTRRAKKEPPAEGGWNMFITAWVATDVLNPVTNVAVNARCDGNNWFGWPCDEELEALRQDFLRADGLESQQELAEQIQLRALEIATHAHLGQWSVPAAWGVNVDGILDSPVPVYWNLSRTE